MTFQSLENGGAKLTCERASFKLMAPEFEAFPEIQEQKKAQSNTNRHLLKHDRLHHLCNYPGGEPLHAVCAKVEIDESSMRMITTDGHAWQNRKTKKLPARRQSMYSSHESSGRIGQDMLRARGHASLYHRP